MTDVILVPCEFNPVTETEPGHIPVPRDWRQNLFAHAMEVCGSSIYGTPSENWIDDCVVEKIDPYTNEKYFCIDNDLFYSRGEDWDCRLGPLPNFVFKPWNFKVYWYKYAFRGAYSNTELTDLEWQEMCQHLINWGDAHKNHKPEPTVPECDKRTEADKTAEIWQARLHKVAEQRDHKDDIIFEFLTALSDYDKNKLQEALNAMVKATAWDTFPSTKFTEFTAWSMETEADETAATIIITNHDSHDNNDNEW